MGPTKLFRVGALALSATALAFVVWTAAAPGCAPNEVATPDPAKDTKTPPGPPATGTAVATADTATPANAAVENGKAGSDAKVVPSADPPRFMGASKAAPVWDEGHMPGKKTPPASEPAVQQNAPPQKGGGSK